LGTYPRAERGSGVVGRSLNAEHVAYWEGVASITRPGTESIRLRLRMAGYADLVFVEAAFECYIPG
jgi:hypothetical protein